MNWPKVSLGTISEKIDYGLSAAAVDKADGPRFLRITDMQNDSVDWNLVPSCECSQNEFERNCLDVGDIVFARTGATTGKSYLIRSLDKPSVFASYLIRVRPTDGVDAVYLSYFFKSPQYWHQITAMKNGAAQPGVNSSKLRELKVPLPPLDEQKRIAAILDKADAIRRKRQQANKLADKFLRSVFLKLFGDPVTNPKGWPTEKLNQLTSKVGSGATPRGGKASYRKEGVSLIRSLNVHDNKFLRKDLAFISQDQADRLSNVVVEENDILLNITGASVCRCAAVDKTILPARVNQHVCIIRPKTIDQTYLLHLLISSQYKNYLLRMAGMAGATREALTKDQVENLIIPVPPVHLQQKFSAISNLISSLRKRSVQFIDAPLFEALSQKAFSGNL